MNLSAQLNVSNIAARKIALLTTEQKNTLLKTIADALRNNTDRILSENEKDIAEGKKNNLGSMLDRLLLTSERIEAMARDTENVADLKDFVGEVLSQEIHHNGMKIQKIRVPLGVVAMIYESRPNVTVDATVLALKSGNAIVLKGGKEAVHSNRVLADIMREALQSVDIDPEAIQLLDRATRADTAELIKSKGMIDILIPRGSSRLIQFVNEHATVPVIETGASVVHTFVDQFANIDMAVDICVNEKVRRVSVCNALDTILVHEEIAPNFLPKLASAFTRSAQEKSHPKVQIHADPTSFSILEKENYALLTQLQPTDYDTEWLDYAMSICVLSSIDQAIQHIRTHSLKHSESIVTQNTENATRFLNEVDAACVYHNASTCFSDGAQFGLGAEIGISTQKLHARGPFALQGLTSEKWVIHGNGQTRQ